MVKIALVVVAWVVGVLVFVEGSRGEGRVVKVAVVEEGSGEGVAGAGVRVRTDREQKVRELVADGAGVVEVGLPEGELKYLNITATAAGRVPTSVALRAEDGRGAITVPGEVTVPVGVGTVIGGVIQDAEGKPIEGATVYLLVPANGPAGKPRPAIWDHAVKTGADGRWRCDVMPADLPDVWIRLKHPEYASDTTYGATPKPAMEKLRDETGVMVMRRGITVSGRVTGPDGKPVEGATVAQGRDRWGSHYPSAKTDAEGRYAFKNARAGEMVLTVQAKGFAPELKTLAVQEGRQEPVDFVLPVARVLRGRVVDADGKAVAGATVVADTWRGCRSISFQTETDDEGRFVWEGAPADGVEFHVLKEGYASNREATLVAGEGAADERTVTLVRPLKATVTVTDAGTGRPVTRFALLRGIWWGNDRQGIYWERREAGVKEYAGGVAEVDFDMARPGHAVRVEADGYAPEESRVLKDAEGAVALAMKLRRAANLEGVVLTPDGKPAAGAEVGLAVLPYGIRVENGHIAQQSDHPVTRTGADGRFSFPPQTGKYKVVVAHESGFAQVGLGEFGMDKPIRLEAWGRVEGIVRVGAKAAAGEVVYGWYQGQAYQEGEPQVMLWVRSNTGADGRFRIDRVAPGEVHVGREVKLSERTTGYSHMVPVVVKAGEEVSVTIGGTGRPVTGRVEIPAELIKRGNWTASRAELVTDVAMPKPPAVPEEVRAMTQEQRAKWLSEWAEGKAFEEAQRKAFARRRSYPVALRADGTYRVEDVPAGAYKLGVSLADLPAGQQCGWGDELATGSADVVVPEMKGGRSDEPLEVATLTLAAVKRVGVGDVAPGFVVKTLDGGELKLESFRGKYVLLDFWATWCGPCVAEVPHLKAAWERYGKDPRLAIVSLSLDERPETAAEFVRKNGMGWEQGFLGEWSKATVPNEYGVRGIPATFLVGPDGKVVARDLRGERVREEVGRVLAK